MSLPKSLNPPLYLFPNLCLYLCLYLFPRGHKYGHTPCARFFINISTLSRSALAETFLTPPPQPVVKWTGSGRRQWTGLRLVFLNQNRAQGDWVEGVFGSEELNRERELGSGQGIKRGTKTGAKVSTRRGEEVAQ